MELYWVKPRITQRAMSLTATAANAAATTTCASYPLPPAICTTAATAATDCYQATTHQDCEEGHEENYGAEDVGDGRKGVEE